MAVLAEIAGDESPPPLPPSEGGEASGAPSTSSPSDADGGGKPSPRTSKPGRKRLVLTASVLLSLPLLLKSTEIHRSPLPSDAIAALSRRLHSNPPSFPCGLHAVFLRSGRDPSEASVANRIEREISTQLVDLPDASTAGKISVSVTVESAGGCSSSSKVASPWRCGAVTTADLGRGDEVFDELLDSALGDGGGDGMRVYTVVFVDSDDLKRIVIGKHRHAWVVGKVDEAEVVSIIGKVFVKEFENIGQRMLTPVIEALRPIANINIESQVLYHTPKSSYSYSDDKLGGNVLSVGDIPFFLQDDQKFFNFVVYIPSARECPLYLQLPDGELSKTNAFISPMWGGVVIWNPPGCSFGSKPHGALDKMSSEELMQTIEIFIGQLRQLFGLKSSYHTQSMDGVTKFITSPKGFAQCLQYAIICINQGGLLSKLEDPNYMSTAEILNVPDKILDAICLISICLIVQSLPRMIVMDEIGRQVELSLEAASLAQRNASLGISDSSAGTLIFCLH
ncbi:hypothetical protein OsI_04848 [Oryza sativa Indica Group]|uniref:Uncharacterized protein n=1 Tax=Oryza sativa subsp. indica TaxID=39946 RepID=A2WY43_ORYSI|nr:hypothetical protein OsI_04848 [Oryza sativa Indica Group]